MTLRVSRSLGAPDRWSRPLPEASKGRIEGACQVELWAAPAFVDTGFVLLSPTPAVSVLLHMHMRETR